MLIRCASRNTKSEIEVQILDSVTGKTKWYACSELGNMTKSCEIIGITDDTSQFVCDVLYYVFGGRSEGEYKVYKNPAVEAIFRKYIKKWSKEFEEGYLVKLLLEKVPKMTKKAVMNFVASVYMVVRNCRLQFKTEESNKLRLEVQDTSTFNMFWFMVTVDKDSMKITCW